MVDPMWGPKLLRENGEPCHVSFMRVNRQLYEEGVKLLYADRTFEVIMSARGTDFLLHHYAWNDRNGTHDGANYARLIRFPFWKIGTLRITLWPVDLRFFLFHLREEIFAFLDFLQWGKLGPRQLEVRLDHGPSHLVLKPHRHEYAKSWFLKKASDSTGTGQSDIKLLMEPFTLLRDITKVAVSLPSVISYMARGDPVHPNQEVIDTIQSCLEEIIRPKASIDQAFEKMQAMNTSWWTEYLPGLRATCGKGNKHHVADSGNVKHMFGRACMCEGRVLGPEFEIIGESSRKLPYPDGSLTRNLQFRKHLPKEKMLRGEFAAEPTVAESTYTEPTTTEPSTTASKTTAPTTSAPATTAPAATQPTVTEPVTT